MLTVMVYVLFNKPPAVLAAYIQPTQNEARLILPAETQEAGSTNLPLPPLLTNKNVVALARFTNPHTIIPERARSTPIEYTVEKGDSLFGIAKYFDLKPGTILWANVDVLNDNPHQLSIAQVLRIPPTDGILYKWKEGDTLEGVASKFKVDSRAILTWPGNKLDLLAPVLTAGTWVMVPGGWRPTQPWLVPTIWRSGSGASKNIAGGCAIADGGAVGSGYFIWPAGNHYLSGNDYYEGHLAVDIAAGDGAPVFASDGGVIVYAAPIGGGYGNMVMIDHGNGFTTLYAHLSVIQVRCGQSVGQGQRLGLAGSTGNSTGAHLHFEIRQNGAFINPWFVLP
jgi:murein DD-endopeptidase MepM/ murein hydrolase activator NlpD